MYITDIEVNDGRKSAFFNLSKLPLRGYIYPSPKPYISFCTYLLDWYISYGIFVPRAYAVNRFNALSMLNFVGRFKIYVFT